MTCSVTHPRSEALGGVEAGASESRPSLSWSAVASAVAGSMAVETCWPDCASC